MLIQSESTKAINSALLKAQGAFGIVGKTKNNDFYKRGGKSTKYAAYDDIYAMAKPVLILNGLLIEHEHNIQYKDAEMAVTVNQIIGGTGEIADTKTVQQVRAIVEVVVNTTIIHVESGEYKTIIGNTFPDKTNAHGVFGAVTYLKRYNLTSLLDIAVGDEDDDGNSAVNEPSHQYDRSRSAPSTRPTPRAPQQTMVARTVTVPVNATIANELANIPLKTGTGVPVNLSNVTPQDLTPQAGDLPFNGPTTPPASAPSAPRPLTATEKKRLGLITDAQCKALIEQLKKIDAPVDIVQKKWKELLMMEYMYQSVEYIQAEKYAEILKLVTEQPDIIMNYGEEVQ